MAIYNNDRDPNEEMWERQSQNKEIINPTGWDKIFRYWINETTRFNISSFIEWLKDNYKVPDIKENTLKINRFEVIDHSGHKPGRELVKYNVEVELSFQDDGKTLKVFLTDKAS